MNNNIHKHTLSQRYSVTRPIETTKQSTLNNENQLSSCVDRRISILRHEQRHIQLKYMVWKKEIVDWGTKGKLKKDEEI